MYRLIGWAVLSASVLVVESPNVFAQANQDYDIWLVTSSDGTPFSASHKRRQRQADGNWRVIDESRTLVNFLGQRQENLHTTEVIATQNFEPVRYRFASKSLSGDSLCEGRVENGEYILTVRRGETSLERRASLADKPILADLLTDYLATRTDAQQPIKLCVLAGKEATLRKATARREAGPEGRSIWTVQFEDGIGTLRPTLLADGRLESMQTTYPNRRVEPAAAESAKQIRYLTLADRELLTFAVKQPIPFPEKSDSIDVRLAWKNLPWDAVNLEDTRQKLAEHESHDDLHRALVKLQKPTAVTAPASLPVTDPALARYLAEDEYIRPNHPAIRARAAKWTGGSKNTLEAAQALCHHVSEYLTTGELIAETLSGPEVLECKKGKCVEFTTLLASLGRAAGVPTRIGFGMRLVGGSFVGHVWCEMWVGQWIPVDATADEVGGSAALLKLMHSDSIMGTQRVRWAMAESLDVEVVGVERAASLSALKTGIDGRTYANADYQFRITTPGDDWKIVDRSAGGNVLLEIKPPGNAPAINLLATGMTVKLEVANMVASRKSIYSQRPGYELVREEAKTIAGDAGRLFEFRLEAGGQARKAQSTEVLWMHDKTFYLMNFATSEAGHAQALAQLESLLAGFEQVQPPTP